MNNEEYLRLIVEPEIKIMKQTKLQSFTEATVNVFTGAVISFSITQLLAPVLDIQIEYHANLILTLILTFVSVTRSYLWRRYFNKSCR